MKKFVLFLVVFLIVFSLTALGLRFVYGDSYTFFSGEDAWIPDGNGGWIAHGKPAAAIPNSPSVNVPIIIIWAPLWVSVLIISLAYFLEIKNNQHLT
jgi:hypothetical protein